MREPVVVLGGNPGAVRAAAAFSLAGHPVHLLEPGYVAGGLAWPDLPVDLGWSERAPAPGSLAERLVGPCVEVPGSTSVGIFAEGRIHRLPLGYGDLFRLTDPLSSLRLGRGVAWALTQDRLSVFFGSYGEVRSYRDWVVSWFGRAAFEMLYASYCARRWGPPEEIGAAVAARFHGREPPAPTVACSEPPADQWATWLATVERAGGRVVLRAGVRRILAEGGRAVGVELGDGEEVRGRVVCAGLPRHLAKQAGDLLPAEIASDLGALRWRRSLQVLVPVEGEEDLPTVVHLLDPDSLFFRVFRPSVLPGCGHLARHLVVHASVAEGDPLGFQDDDALVRAASTLLRRAGIARPRTGPGRVLRLDFHDPVWTRSWYPTWVRVLEAAEQAGVLLVGRTGAFGLLDPVAEAGLLEDCLRPDRSWREAHRAWVDPPGRTGSEEPSPRRFITP